MAKPEKKVAEAEKSPAEMRAAKGAGGFNNSKLPKPVALHASIAEHAEARAKAAAKGKPKGDAKPEAESAAV